MLNYIMRRLNLLLFTLLMLSLLAYCIDVTLVNPRADGLVGGYFRFLARLLEGDLGFSSSSNQPVAELIRLHLPATVELCLAALLLAMLMGITLGTLAALNQGRWVDRIILGLSLLGYSMPAYWLGMLLIMTLSMDLGWLPSSGQLSLLYEVKPVTGFTLMDTWLSHSPYREAAFRDALAHLLLPAVVLAIVPTTEVIRLVRGAMINVLKQNYIKAAFSRGLSAPRVMFKHGLRNALPPIVPMLSLQFGSLVTAAVITEVVFSWPGMGRWLVNSIQARDYAAIEGGVLVIACFLVVVNLLSESLTTLLYPAKRKDLYGQED
ncbi:ABC transporter permease subunit [Pseudaeromonas paramecii]|uniref:ABC transporter permease subunit n=1 Tax=Pseudaeromonas paramecii TaxID=2138166 RepID=A0ABP8PVY4_9GAMM